MYAECRNPHYLRQATRNGRLQSHPQTHPKHFLRQIVGAVRGAHINYSRVCVREERFVETYMLLVFRDTVGEQWMMWFIQQLHICIPNIWSAFLLAAVTYAKNVRNPENSDVEWCNFLVREQQQHVWQITRRHNGLGNATWKFRWQYIHRHYCGEHRMLLGKIMQCWRRSIVQLALNVWMSFTAYCELTHYVIVITPSLGPGLFHQPNWRTISNKSNNICASSHAGAKFGLATAVRCQSSALSSTWGIILILIYIVEVQWISPLIRRWNLDTVKYWWINSSVGIHYQRYQ